MTTHSLKNKRILITCGPTWVPIDDVRVISNRSTGALGQALARNLAKAGAKVTVLEGPVLRPLEVPGVRIVKYQFFHELFLLMRQECRKKYHAVIHAAAISDFQLKARFKEKISSGRRKLKLELVPTPKIIESIKEWAPKTCLVGFKLETRLTNKDLPRIARAMAQNCGCDLVLANTSSTNAYKGYVLSPDGTVLARQNSRAEIARSLQKILGQRL